MKHRIALVTKNQDLVREVEDRLTGTGFEGALAVLDDVQDLVDPEGQNGSEVVLLDVDTITIGALSGLKKHCLVIVITSQQGSRYLIESMTFGAFDCLLRPLEAPKLTRALEKSSGIVSELKKEGIEYQGNVEGSGVTCAIVGASPMLQEVCKLIGSVGQVDIPILITGESGTGKDLVAESIWKVSKRWEKPFVVLNCAAIPETLLEAELFGYERGSFTGAVASRRGKFEEADGGTIFLDEIGDMSLQLQSKVLRVLQNGTFHRIGDNREIRVNVRLMAATNQDLKQMISTGRFREDLYYRINVVRVHLPSLRERKSDIPLLVECFVRRHSAQAGKEIRGVTGEFLAKLMSYDWPGNIRELENSVRKAIAFAKAPWLTSFDLEIDSGAPVSSNIEILNSDDVFRNSIKTMLGDNNGGESNVYGVILKGAEKVILEEALSMCGWNKSQAARVLGINRITLRRKIEEYGLEDHKNA